MLCSILTSCGMTIIVSIGWHEFVLLVLHFWHCIMGVVLGAALSVLRCWCCIMSVALWVLHCWWVVLLVLLQSQSGPVADWSACTVCWSSAALTLCWWHVMLLLSGWCTGLSCKTQISKSVLHLCPLWPAVIYCVYALQLCCGSGLQRIYEFLQTDEHCIRPELCMVHEKVSLWLLCCNC